MSLLLIEYDIEFIILLQFYLGFLCPWDSATAQPKMKVFEGESEHDLLTQIRSVCKGDREEVTAPQPFSLAEQFAEGTHVV